MEKTKSQNGDTYLIIPVYNEAGIVGDVIKNCQKYFKNIICVNDGSQDNSADIIQATKARLVSHAINLGQGAALQTGIEYGLQDKAAKYFITFDSDGQHQVKDAVKMVEYLRRHKRVDIVLGSRFLGKTSNISLFKKMLLKLAITFSNFNNNTKLTDAHNGLRAFTRQTAKRIDITLPGMAHASEIIEKISDLNLNYVELPVNITYSDYSKTKGQSAMNSINIVFDLFINKVTKKWQ